MSYDVKGTGPYFGQVTYERGFKTKAEAERWLQGEDTKLTLAAEVDSISTSLWEPATDAAQTSLDRRSR